MACCGQNTDIDELKNIESQAAKYAEKKGEIVVVFKQDGFYKYGLSLPTGAKLIEYIGKSS